MTAGSRVSWSPVVLGVALLVAACGGNGNARNASNDTPAAAGTTAVASDQARPRIVALGDSLTAGLGLAESEAYPALLQQKIDRAGYRFQVVNAGVSGDTSAGGLRRLDWALEGDVRVLIVALGANDGLRGLPVAQMRTNLAEIIEQAKEKKIVVILAGMEAPPNYGPEYTAGFRQVYQDLAREQRVVFLPFLLAKVAGESGLNQGDGIHPNAAGAAVIADAVWGALRPVLDELAGAS